jgi:hypothetical protein
MIGLELEYNGKIFNGSLDGVVDVMLIKRNDKLSLNFGGLDRNNISYEWVKNVNLETGDKISIKVKDIVLNSRPIQKIPYAEAAKGAPLTDEEIRLMYQEKLEYFHMFEDFLKKEGLI